MGRLLIGTLFLLVGIPVGILLAKKTNDESKIGQKWFKTIILVSLCGGFLGLVIQNDILFFSFLFMAIVTSKSLKKR